MDARCDNSYLDVDGSMESILKLIKECRAYSLWNDHSVSIPKWIKVKVAVVGENISSFDLLVFAVEELSTLETQLYSENEMFDIIKRIKVGDVFGRSKVKRVSTELKDGYYYSVGILTEDGNFKDVYSLTMYYLKDVLSII